MAFLETPRFPDDIAYGSSFQTLWSTSVVASQSGHEQRNQLWAESRKRIDVGYGTRTIAQLHEVIKYFEAVQGRTHGFRFKDPTDYKSCDPEGTAAFTDIQFGTGDDSTVVFQLVKKYTKGALTQDRTINKPVSGTILIGVNGVQQTEGPNYSIDYTTGVVTFTAAPSAGQAITWGGEFDVPVRFDQDTLEVDVSTLDAGALSIPLIELRI